MEIELLGVREFSHSGPESLHSISGQSHTWKCSIHTTADIFPSMCYVLSLIKCPCCSESIVYTSWGFHVGLKAGREDGRAETQQVPYPA